MLFVRCWQKQSSILIYLLWLFLLELWEHAKTKWEDILANLFLPLPHLRIKAFPVVCSRVICYMGGRGMERYSKFHGTFLVIPLGNFHPSIILLCVSYYLLAWKFNKIIHGRKKKRNIFIWNGKHDWDIFRAADQNTLTISSEQQGLAKTWTESGYGVLVSWPVQSAFHPEKRLHLWDCWEGSLWIFPNSSNWLLQNRMLDCMNL